MVRLKMVDYQEIRLPAFQGLCQVGFPLFCLAGVCSVQDGGLPVQDKVRIVRNTLWNYILTLE